MNLDDVLKRYKPTTYEVTVMPRIDLEASAYNADVIFESCVARLYDGDLPPLVEKLLYRTAERAQDRSFIFHTILKLKGDD